MHRLLALRARLRGSAGHLRADHLRPRLRQPRVARHERELPRLRMRVLRRLRAGLPDRDADREDRDRDRPARAFGGHDLRLLRRRLHLQGRDARRGSRAHGAVQGRQGQSRPFLRQGPLRLGLRHPQGPHPQADDPREDHRSLARSVAGTRRSPTPPPSSSASRPSTAATRSAASPRRAAPTRKPIWCRSWSAPASATTTSIPAPASAIRRPATACRPTFGTSAGTQDFDSVEHADVDHGHRRQPDRRPSGVRLAHEEAAAPGRQADRHRSAPHRSGAHRRTSRRAIICRCCPAPTSRC